ncbi:hypothetical protein H6504_01270 [Candidatus Woesearchaeota archaeon]|nr:hypothetical protein [Candidatus Woesearchaeota archaeon]
MADRYLSDTTAFNNYAKAFDLTFSNFVPLVVMVLIIVAFETVNSFIPFINLFITLLITTPLQYGMAGAYLKAAREEKFEIANMFDGFKENYGNIVLAGLLTTIFIILGFILLIIPGIILTIRLCMVPYLLMDKKMEAMDAIKGSWNMTRGYSWTIFGMWFIAILIAILGLIAMLVGFFVSIAIITAANAVLYNAVLRKKEGTIRITKKTDEPVKSLPAKKAPIKKAIVKTPTKKVPVKKKVTTKRK